MEPLKLGAKDKKVIKLTDGTAVLYSDASPMVTINQLDALGDQRYDYESVFLTKNNIIHLASKFIREGAEHDLSYEELKGMIDNLQEKLWEKLWKL